MKLTKKDCELLINTRCRSFYSEQKNRFEHIKGNLKNINKKGMFNFVDNDLSDLFVFNYFKLKKFNPVLLWDTSQSNWCIFSNQNWQQYMKGK